jgi:hypothetical protein
MLVTLTCIKLAEIRKKYDRFKKKSGGGGEQNTWLSNAFRLSKQLCFLEGSQALPVCPSGNRKHVYYLSEEWCDDVIT